MSLGLLIYPPRGFFLLHCLLLLFLVVELVEVAGTIVVLSCNQSGVMLLQSHQTYILEGCNRWDYRASSASGKDMISPPIFTYTGNETFPCVNSTLIIRNCTILPMLDITMSSSMSDSRMTNENDNVQCGNCTAVGLSDASTMMPGVQVIISDMMSTTFEFIPEDEFAALFRITSSCVTPNVSILFINCSWIHVVTPRVDLSSNDVLSKFLVVWVDPTWNVSFQLRVQQSQLVIDAKNAQSIFMILFQKCSGEVQVNEKGTIIAVAFDRARIVLNGTGTEAANRLMSAEISVVAMRSFADTSDVSGVEVLVEKSDINCSWWNMDYATNRSLPANLVSMRALNQKSGGYQDASITMADSTIHINGSGSISAISFRDVEFVTNISITIVNVSMSLTVAPSLNNRSAERGAGMLSMGATTNQQVFVVVRTSTIEAFVTGCYDITSQQATMTIVLVMLKSSFSDSTIALRGVTLTSMIMRLADLTQATTLQQMPFSSAFVGVPLQNHSFTNVTVDILSSYFHSTHQMATSALIVSSSVAVIGVWNVQHSSLTVENVTLIIHNIGVVGNLASVATSSMISLSTVFDFFPVTIVSASATGANSTLVSVTDCVIRTTMTTPSTNIIIAQAWIILPAISHASSLSLFSSKISRSSSEDVDSNDGLTIQPTVHGFICTRQLPALCNITNSTIHVHNMSIGVVIGNDSNNAVDSLQNQQEQLFAGGTIRILCCSRLCISNLTAVIIPPAVLLNISFTAVDDVPTNFSSFASTTTTYIHLTRSRLVGYHAVLDVTDDTFVSPSSCAIEDSPRIAIDASCVRWNSATRYASPTDIFPATSVPDAAAALCVRVNVTDTETCPWQHTQTASLPYIPPTEAPTPPPPLVSVATAAAVSAVLSAAAALAMVGGAASLGQQLAMVGRAPCSPQPLQTATSDAQFLVSPFYPLGAVGIVVGNTGLLLALVGTQYAAVRVLLRRREGGGKAGAAEARARFPNLAILFAGVSLQGVVLTSVGALGSGEAGPTALGVYGLACVGVAVAAWRRLERGAAVRRLRFRRYRVSVLRLVRWVPRWALPLGRWGPDAVAATHGKLRSSVRPGAEWLGSYTSVYALATNAIAGLPVPASYCLGVWVPLAVAAAACAVFVERFRPSRVPLVDHLNAAVLACNAVLGVAAGVVQRLEASGDASNGTMTAATSALMGVSIVQTVCTLLRGVHWVFVFVWERHVNASPVSPLEEVRPEPSAALFLSVSDVGSRVRDPRRKDGWFQQRQLQQQRQGSTAHVVHARDQTGAAHDPLSILITEACRFALLHHQDHRGSTARRLLQSVSQPDRSSLL